ncbi:hypothetical protein ABIA32_002562 [Streptacidiphilus sp. MAP12-20]
MSGGGEGPTGFRGAALPDLRAMIADADAGGLDAVAAKWSAVHDALRQAQDDLLHHTLAATTHWTGAAADAFAARADELHLSLGNGAAYAFNASSGVSCAADALRTAQSTMPAAPDPLEQAARCAAAGTCGEPSPLMVQRRSEAAGVMERLEERYRAAGEMIGTPARSKRAEDRGVFPPPPETSVHNNKAQVESSRQGFKQGTSIAATDAGLLSQTPEAIGHPPTDPGIRPVRSRDALAPTPGSSQVSASTSMPDSSVLPGDSGASSTTSMDQHRSSTSHISTSHRGHFSEDRQQVLSRLEATSSPVRFGASAQNGSIDNLQQHQSGTHVQYTIGGEHLRPSGSNEFTRQGLPLQSDSGTAAYRDAKEGPPPFAPPAIDPPSPEQNHCSTNGGIVPFSRQSTPSRGRRRRAQYLTEDESTWLQTTSANPQVIE